jgi:DNA-binding protein HU-beta
LPKQVLTQQPFPPFGKPYRKTLKPAQAKDFSLCLLKPLLVKGFSESPYSAHPIFEYINRLKCCLIADSSHLDFFYLFKNNFIAIKNLLYLSQLNFFKNSIMNKAELITKIADDAGITKTQANASVDSLIEAVTKTLKSGGKVTLVGFGTFSVSKRAARNGRNPQTGAVIKIKAKKVAKFKAGKELSAKI